MVGKQPHVPQPITLQCTYYKAKKILNATSESPRGEIVREIVEEVSISKDLASDSLSPSMSAVRVYEAEGSSR